VTSVRLAKLYGAAPGLPWREVPHVLAARSVAGEPLVVCGGDQVFDLLHIRDAVSALLQFARRDAVAWAPVYNVGGGAPVTLLDISLAAVDAALQIGRHPGDLQQLPGQGPTRRFGLESRLFRDQLGWSPRVDLATAMKELAVLAAAGAGL
jgi:UDP-glucose 4-epimerase